MKFPIFIAAAGLTASSILATSASLADTKPEIDVSVRETLKQFDGLNSHNAHLLSSAAGTLVFPRVTKGGLGVAGEYGEGALRIDGKTVGYYSVSSASVGLTVGAAKRSEVMIFTTNSPPAKDGPSARIPESPWYLKVPAETTTPRPCRSRL
jgi:lipid-binding SYLF domain-containing protein